MVLECMASIDIWWSLILLSYKLLQLDVKGFTLILDVSLGYT